jgi:predicted transcriptional regulator
LTFAQWADAMKQALADVVSEDVALAKMTGGVLSKWRWGWCARKARFPSNL